MACTRKQRAEKLGHFLVEGPSLAIDHPDADSLTVAQRQNLEQDMERKVRIWLDTWVLPEMSALVRELPVKPDA